jgi:hypothetical protein
MDTVMTNQKLLILVSTAKLHCLGSDQGQEWLDDVKDDIEKNRVSAEVTLVLLKGFIKGLYVAGMIEFEDECDFSELMAGLE